MSMYSFSIKDNSNLGAMSTLSTDTVIVKSWQTVSASGSTKVVYAELLVNEISDLPPKDSYTGYTLSTGSMAVVASRGITYRLDSEGRWRNQNSGCPAENDMQMFHLNT
ncbi:MAG: hypothetical protein IJ874_09120 [Ruminococcus sp.]|nr:hypothetical protein [Ruminococcus sp.]